MNILLTGASGFVGRHFCGENDIKRVVVRNSENNSNWKCDQYQVNNIDGKTCWSGAFDGIDVVIHLAGLAHSRKYTKYDYQSVNIDGAIHLAKEAASSGVKRFVYVSSIGVLGSNTGDSPFTLDSPLLPENAYTQSKMLAEIGLEKISQETGLELVIVRPTLVYGADAPGNFGMLTKLVSYLPILPFGLVNNKRDFIAVDNLRDFLMCCALHPAAKGEIFLASDGETISIGEFTNQIARGLSLNRVQLPIPPSLFRFLGRLSGKSQLVEQLVGNLHVDNSNLEKKLGWSSPYTMKEVMSRLRKGKK